MAHSSSTLLNMVQEIDCTMQILDSIEIQCDHFFTANRKINSGKSLIEGHIGSLSSVKLLNVGEDPKYR